MTLFRNTTHREVWIQRWCHTCFQPDEAARRIQGKDTACPILTKALRTDRKPPEWDRNTRTDEMQRSIKCNSYQDRPMRLVKSDKEFEDVPMLDVKPAELKLVPVEGWPDFRQGKDDGDHA